MDIHTNNAELRGAELSYAWQMVRDHAHACGLYFSSQEILIRPLIPPTWTHRAFMRAKQRIYMSATLGEGGDLERLVGRETIRRLPVSEGWEGHGVGRRFFVFPEMSLSADDARKLRLELIRRTDRSLVLVPNIRSRDEIEEEVSEALGYQVFSADDIEGTKGLFIRTKAAVAIIANRYDGIDFPGDECRLLFVEGLPRATNLQEQFLMSRMGANVLFNERVQTRVLQAIGRCTRSLEDYSAVVVSGGELPDYLADGHRRKYFHPELQAELTFGIHQSKDVKSQDIIENFTMFLDNGQDWEKVNQQIVSLRKGMRKQSFPCMAELQNSVSEEIQYQKRMWQKDYEAALASADAALSFLKSPELQGYRALWHYLAGSAAWLAVNGGGSSALEARAREEFSRAKDAAVGITWLVPLARYCGQEPDQQEADNSTILEQVERLESVLASLGTTYERQYLLREKEILEGLMSDNTDKFEHAHKLLGTMLGFESDNKDTDGAPDPWWISSSICLVFEDHSGASETTIVSVNKARQAASHPAWMRANVPAAEKAEILPVLITPAKAVRTTAVSHLGGVSLWALNDFRQWGEEALTVIKELRTTFTEPGNLVWRADAMTVLKQKQFDAVSLFKRLKDNKAAELLRHV